MRLVDLDPAFAEDIDGSLMLTLLCPTCGGHHVGAPVVIGPKQPGKWAVTSRDFNTLTLEPSILHNWGKDVPEEQRCPFHFKITNGEVIQC